MDPKLSDMSILSCVDHEVLRRVVNTAEHITGRELPALPDTYHTCCLRKALRMMKDSQRPAHTLLSVLPSGRHIWQRPVSPCRLKDTFCPRAIRRLNSCMIYYIQMKVTCNK